MNKTASARILPWLRENLGKNALAPLTSTDAAALRAAVEIVEVISIIGYKNTGLLTAFNRVVSLMQPSCQRFAYHGIAMIMDWPDREKLWDFAQLDPLPHRGICKYEPAARTALATV